MRASAPDAAALAGLVVPSPAHAPPPGAPAFESPVFVPQQATSAEPQRRRKPLSPFVWIAMAGAGVFGMTLAAMVGTSLLRQQAVAPAVAVVAPPAAPVQEAVPAAPIPIPETPTPAVVEETAAVIPPSGPRTPTKRGNGAATTAGARQLSAAEQAAIVMTGGGSAGSDLAPPVRPAGAERRPPSEPAQLRVVVTRNRRACSTATRWPRVRPARARRCAPTSDRGGRLGRRHARERDGQRADAAHGSVSKDRSAAGTSRGGGQLSVVFSPGG